MTNHSIASQVFEIIEPIVAEEGLTLYDVVWTNDLGQHVLRVLLENPDGPVTLSDCTKVSHAIEDIIEVKNSVPEKYCLEVSSPGLDRPLNRKEHFDKVLGKLIRVKTKKPLDGRGNYKGILKSTGPKDFNIEIDGRDYVVPFDQVAKANLEVVVP